MGTVFRKTRTQPLPAGAELFTRAGQQFAKWKPAKGKARTARVTTSEDGGLRIQTEAATYTAKFRDGLGHIREVSTGCRDEDAARSILGKLERRAELVRSGVITAAEDAVSDHQLEPIADHFEAFVDHLRARETSPVRIKNMRSQFNRIKSECGFRKLSDLDGGVLTKWLLQRETEGMSAATRNGYRETLVMFANWCSAGTRPRLMGNPLANVPRANVKTDRRRHRRAMTETELLKLLQVATLRPLAEHGREAVSVDAHNSEATGKRRKRSNWTYKALTLDSLPAAVERARERLAKNPDFIADLERLGRERALIYKTLVLTGLRRNELATLKVSQCDFDGPMPFVTLEAGNEKNRQGNTIPLRLDLANDLKGWLSDVPNASTLRLRDHSANRETERKLFRVPSGLVRAFNGDLRAAAIPKKDERGRTLDIHALRATFATLLSKGGVAPRTAQAAMRHSNINLTMGAYTDAKLLDVQGALDSLPSLSLNSSPLTDQATLRATGTDCRKQWSSTSSPKDSPNNSPATGFRGLSESFSDLASASINARTGLRANEETPANPNKKAPFAGFANRASKVGMTGFEPAASTSRT
ncbi:MAG: site-specific integrase [Planctomycetia bacterium]|nr:site-specific integrase [Planctomycetia bacterium]